MLRCAQHDKGALGVTREALSMTRVCKTSTRMEECAVGRQVLRCAQHDKGGVRHGKGGAQYDKGAFGMIGLDLSINDDLSSLFEPCLNIERVRV